MFINLLRMFSAVLPQCKINASLTNTTKFQVLNAGSVVYDTLFHGLSNYINHYHSTIRSYTLSRRKKVTK